MSVLDHRIPPPLVGGLVAAAMWTASGLGPALLLPALPRLWLLAVLVVTGLAFDLLGLLAFRRSRTTVNPLRPERTTAMVTDGVYGVTRNPMYLGMLILLVAWAVHLSALPTFLGPVLFALYITRFQIAPEERVLARTFGPAYDAYAARVRRWL